MKEAHLLVPIFIHLNDIYSYFLRLFSNFTSIGINPGWTNLVGVEYKMAIQIIKQDMPGVLVEYKPADRLPPDNIRINRVILYINPDGNVDRTPKVG
jgi:hypothetical protein